MAEIQIRRRERLYDLLLLKKMNAGVAVKGLSYLISRTKAGMLKEDIAFVEKLVEQEDEL